MDSFTQKSIKFALAKGDKIKPLLQNKTCMRGQYKYLDAFIDKQRANGKYSFTITDLRNYYSLTDEALKKSLQRLKKQKKVAMVRKEFYVIVPPEYSAKGIIPTSFYVNDLMRFLDRDYYVGLLNAAALHGAAHQQPQTYSIITEGIPLRKIQNNKVNIVFFTKKSWNKDDVEKKKVDTGYLNISSPELTALDLVSYYDAVGGFNRVATIIEELKENINVHKLKNSAKRYDQIVASQRLGYLLEFVLNDVELSNGLFDYLKNNDFYPALLRPQQEKTDSMATGNRWKIVPNIEIETDI
ncbi:MAG TPA: hypothetical protein DDZ57_05810 [Porphyromonadaceae bacterium]|jgi:predicted transcriptional regulator of viral defense system|nr:hypothetical protein [Porphyromonadaceae bacterium]